MRRLACMDEFRFLCFQVGSVLENTLAFIMSRVTRLPGPFYNRTIINALCGRGPAARPALWGRRRGPSILYFAKYSIFSTRYCGFKELLEFLIPLGILKPLGLLKRS